MTRGVLYLVSGASHAVPLAVSLWHLRQRWDGRVCLAFPDDRGGDVARRMHADMRLGPIELLRFDAPRLESISGKQSNPAYRLKPLACSYSPFDEAIYFDADTVVVGDFAALWPGGDQGGGDRSESAVLTQFCEWRTSGRAIQRRLEWWRDIEPGYVGCALAADLPAVNTGVVGFRRDGIFLRAWQELVAKGRVRTSDNGLSAPLTDEIAAQMVAATMWDWVRFVDHTYNLSPVHGPSRGFPTEAARVLHFHGGKHERRAEMQLAWRPLFAEALRADAGGMRTWAPACDARACAWAREAGLL